MKLTKIAKQILKEQIYDPNQIYGELEVLGTCYFCISPYHPLVLGGYIQPGSYSFPGIIPPPWDSFIENNAFTNPAYNQIESGPCIASQVLPNGMGVGTNMTAGLGIGSMDPNILPHDGYTWLLLEQTFGYNCGMDPEGVYSANPQPFGGGPQGPDQLEVSCNADTWANGTYNGCPYTAADNWAHPDIEIITDWGPVDDEGFDLQVYGCTDPTATNYNPSATQDDGSCIYDEKEIPGCTDPTAINYNPNATVDDGSCEYKEKDIYGCTDSTAINYNPNATIDDGSCEYGEKEISGCTDPNALNYNPNATVDDGSCEYKDLPGPSGEMITCYKCTVNYTWTLYDQVVAQQFPADKGCPEGEGFYETDDPCGIEDPQGTPPMPDEDPLTIQMQRRAGIKK